MKIYWIKNFAIRLRFVFISTLLYSLLSPSITYPGEWRVTPIRLDFGKDVKSGVISVINEKDEKLRVQMKASEWTQDAEGKDTYTETNDIIFFPKIMVFEKAEERILRAGIKMPPVSNEKTYRLFIEEIPEPKKAEGVNVAIAIKFGVPIFVKPLKEDAKGEIERLELTEGIMNVAVRNSGNVHFRINSVTISGTDRNGKEIFSKELAGWYLLHGASRVYSTPIPTNICSELLSVEAVVKTDRFVLNSKTSISTVNCGS